MTKTQTFLGIAIILFFTLVAAATHADTRTSLRDGISRAPSLPSPFVPSTPEKKNSGITNTTTVEVESGGNTGGNVTTGNESAELHVVNEGPTNSNNVVTNIGNTPPPPAPEPTCEPSRTTRCDGTRDR